VTEPKVSCHCVRCRSLAENTQCINFEVWECDRGSAVPPGRFVSRFASAEALGYWQPLLWSCRSQNPFYSGIRVDVASYVSTAYASKKRRGLKPCLELARDAALKGRSSAVRREAYPARCGGKHIQHGAKGRISSIVRREAYPRIERDVASYLSMGACDRWHAAQGDSYEAKC